MATEDLNKKVREDRSSSSIRDMIADRQTHTQTDTQTDKLIAILCSPPGRSKNRHVSQLIGLQRVTLGN